MALQRDNTLRDAGGVVETGGAALLADEIELAQLIVTTLNLDVSPEDIDPAAPLYGEGLGLDSALSLFGKEPQAVLEAFVPFRCEVSVIGARGRDGAFAAFDVTENRHANHVLRTSQVPASITPELAAEAIALAARIAEGFGYVGVLGVEMFVVPGEARHLFCVLGLLGILAERLRVGDDGLLLVVQVVLVDRPDLEH